MDRKKTGVLLFYLIFIIGFIPNVVFAAEFNFLDSIFEPFGGINIAATYDRFWMVIDTFLYFLFFIGLVQFALKKQFEGSGGKAVIIAFGVALSIGISVWASRFNFKLGDRLGPIAAVIFVIVFFIFIVKIFRGDREEGLVGPEWWLAIVGAYILVNMFV